MDEDIFGLQQPQQTSSRKFFLNADPFQSAQEELQLQAQSDPWFGAAQSLQGAAPVQGDDWKTVLANALLGFGKGVTKGVATNNYNENKEKLYAGLSGALGGDRTALDAFPKVQGAYDGYLELVKQQQNQLRQKQLGELELDRVKSELDLDKQKNLKQFEFDLNKPLKEQEALDKGDQQKAKVADSLRNEIEATPEFKTYSTIKSNMDAMRGIAKQDTRAGDLGLVYQIAKILDPGSVVREGEIKLAQGANSPLFQWASDLNSLVFRNGRLPERTRNELLAVAAQKQLAANKAYESILNPRIDLAKTRGLNVDQIVTLPSLNYGAQSSSSQGSIEVGRDGKKYRVID